MLKLPGPHHADLARPELLGERGTGLGPRAVGDVLGRDHVARPLVDLLDAVADERLVAALVGLDRGTGRPHQRADGEDVAAGAVAGQVVAGDAAAERGDLVGVRPDLGEAGRRLGRIQPGLGEQVLVVEQRRHVGVQRDAEQAVVECGDGLVARADVRQLRPVLRLIRDVDQLAGVLELRGVDQVHAHQVRDVARGDALGDLRHHVRVDDVAQVDRLGRVRRVPGADEDVDHPLVAAGALPHLHRVRRRCSGRRPWRAPGSGAAAARATRMRAARCGAMPTRPVPVRRRGRARAPRTPCSELQARDQQDGHDREGRQLEMGSHPVLLQSTRVAGDRPLTGAPATPGLWHSIMRCNRMHTFDFTTVGGDAE